MNTLQPGTMIRFKTVFVKGTGIIRQVYPRTYIVMTHKATEIKTGRALGNHYLTIDIESQYIGRVN